MTYLNYIFFTRWLYFHHYWWRERGKNQFSSIFERSYLNLRNLFLKIHEIHEQGFVWSSIFLAFLDFLALLWLSITWILKRFEFHTNLCWRHSRNQTMSILQSLCINNSNSHCFDQISCFILITALSLFRFWVIKTLHEKKNFRLTEICEKDRKDHFFVRFHIFPFHGNIIFSELSFKQKCRKAASFHKCVFLRKYEIFVYDSCR